MQTKMREEFAKIFGEGREPEFYFAPGRVNLIGEHTDYNGGHVFPCALSIGTYALARKNDCGKMRFYSLNFTRFGMLAVEGPANEFTNVPADNWCNYPKGVMWAYTQKGYTIDSGLDILYYGNIPNGSGLSSSASIEVATAVILNQPGTQDSFLTALSLSQHVIVGGFVGYSSLADQELLFFRIDQGRGRIAFREGGLRDRAN